ncbi:MAG: 30S ribosomal protein S17 [Bacteroidales bacterium]
MPAKSSVQGVVTSDKMQQTVVVAVERQVRHALYGKIQRRTSKFMAHNEGNTARVGDVVEIVESRPLSRRKRWVVIRIVQRAGQPAGAAEPSTAGEV